MDTSAQRRPGRDKLHAALHALEREMVSQALAKTGSVALAAQELGTTRVQIYRSAQRCGVALPTRASNT